MPTPMAYDDLYRRYEELRWATFRMMCAMSPSAGIGDDLHTEVWDMVGDCDGPPSWLATKQSEDLYTHAVVVRDADGDVGCLGNPTNPRSGGVNAMSQTYTVRYVTNRGDWHTDQTFASLEDAKKRAGDLERKSNVAAASVIKK